MKKIKKIAAPSNMPSITASLHHYSLTPSLALYIWSHAPGPCWDMSRVSLEWPEQRHRLHKTLPVHLQ